MADIAEIGFKADVSDLSKATASLQQLGPAAKRAESAASGVSSALNAAAGAAGKAGSAIDSAASGMNSAAAGMNKVDSASKGASSSLNVVGSAASAAAADLGRVDSSSASAASGLNVVSNAAESAASDLTRIDNAAEQAANGLEQEAAAAMKAAAANDNAANTMNKVGAGAKSNGFAVSNLAAQFQDVAVSAAGGQSAMTVALQQGTQIAMAFGNQGAAGALRTLGSAFVSLVSPVSLISIGLTALAAVIIQTVNWAHAAANAMVAFANVLPIIAPYAVGAAAALALLYAPALIGGILTLISALGNLIMTLLGVAAAGLAAAGWPLLLVAGLTAAVAAAVYFADEIKQAVGVDVIALLTSVGDAIINTFVLAFRVVAKIWQQFPFYMGAAFKAAVSMAVEGINALIQAAVDGLNRVVDIINLTGLGKFLGEGKNLARVNAGEFKIKVDMPGMEKAKADMAALGGELKTMAEQQYGKSQVGPLLKKIGEGAEYAKGKVKGLADQVRALGDADGSGGKGKKGKGGKSAADKMAESYDSLVIKAQNAIKANETAAASVGKSAEETAVAKYQQQLLNEAVQKHIVLTEQQRTELLALGKAWGESEVAAQKAKEAFDFNKGVVKGFVSDLYKGIKDGKSFFESLSDAAMNALDKITDRLLNQVVDALFQTGNATNGLGNQFTNLGNIAMNIFQSISGWLAQLFGGVGGAGAVMNSASLYADGGVFGKSGVKAYAKGGTFTNSIVKKPTMFASGGALGVMGEAGPEAIMPLKRGPDGSLGVQMHSAQMQGAANTNGAPNVYVDIQVNGDAKVTESRETNSNGDQIRKFVIDVVRQGMSGGAFDDVQRSRFGNNTQKVYR